MRVFRPKAQSGQAIVEYVLVLFVILMTAVFFLQFSTAFSGYVDSYVGSYVACLLETGELPALGVENPQEGSICDSEYEPFSLASGRPPRDPTGTGGPSAGTGSGGPSAGTGTTGPTSSQRGGGGQSGGRSRLIGNNSQGIGGAASAGRSRAYVGAGAAGDGDKAKKGKSSQTGGGYTLGRRGRSKTVRYRGISGRYYEEEEEKDKEEKVNDGSGRTSKAVDTGREARKRTLAIGPKPTPTPQVQDDGGWSIGGFFKYLMIAIIGIVILVFLGGQVAQFTKGFEGNG